MQKTFIKYTFAIMTSAVLLIFFINLFYVHHTLKSQQLDTFYVKIEQVIHTLENNQSELMLMNENLDEDYLTRAKAAAYVLDRQQEIAMNVSEMQYLAELLDVDEIHVIDESGSIVYSSVSQYIGFYMAGHPQTEAFLELLEKDGENSYLIQEARPNAAENKIMKYVGVSGQNKIVQVGFEPTRQLEAQSRNTYDYIFSKFPTDVGEEFFVLACDTGDLLGHSGNIEDAKQKQYPFELLLGCSQGSYIKGENDIYRYVVSRQYEDVLICATLPGKILFQRLMENILPILFYLIFIEAIVILLLYFLVKKKVVDGIHSIIEGLSAIAEGNLDTKVTVEGNKEFKELSRGINAMVRSIINLSARISSIIEISGAPLAAFEYEDGVKSVFVTSGLGKLLDIPEQQAAALYKYASRFDRYIHKLIKCPIQGEKDIYQIGESKYVRIHMSKDHQKYLGVVTDVTKDILEKRRMQYENTHDSLTGLYKYKYFKQIASEILKKMPFGTLCCVIMLDLDYFKSINDTFGHDIGDQYLQSFAAVLKDMPVEHFITARRSGDEFCMMLFDCEDTVDIISYLDNFYIALGENQIALSDTQYRTICASAGYAWTRDADMDIEELLRRADSALYKMKRKTRGYYAEYREEEKIT